VVIFYVLDKLPFGGLTFVRLSQVPIDERFIFRFFQEKKSRISDEQVSLLINSFSLSVTKRPLSYKAFVLASLSSQSCGLFFNFFRV
jgi:hypothetical protein